MLGSWLRGMHSTTYILPVKSYFLNLIYLKCLIPSSATVGCCFAWHFSGFTFHGQWALVRRLGKKYGEYSLEAPASIMALVRVRVVGLNSTSASGIKDGRRASSAFDIELHMLVS